ncbi:MAG: type II toxin-antitoxin system RelE/ParE family toxin, partial [Armatimonadetes bacterium]|nr:type II toxin-antitoxin system RelE/ParE family toxin [Armatimonadota bacterium]
DVLRRVDAKLMGLSRNPRQRGAAKLRGRQGEGWRVRIGEYRILYTIDDESRTVTVYRVSPRGSAYK